MRTVTLRGVIRRRILVNFRVDPDVMQRLLPAPFRPQLVAGRAMAGICLVRLEQLRPRGLPAAVGVSSESVAHRVAVTWTESTGAVRRGVYIARRDTGSTLNALAGGRLFPGVQRRARFRVREDAGSIDVTVLSDDGTTDVRLRARTGMRLPATSCFASLEDASNFFAAGTIGYSPAGDGRGLAGLELHASAWRMAVLDVQSVVSGYFGAESRFPPGSAELDSAFIMRDIPHEWRPVRGGEPSYAGGDACDRPREPRRELTVPGVA